MKEETLYMKTLKKTLALVLVLIMALGVFGAVPAAAFTDDAAITYKDAVDLLAALGILNGYEDGSFKPDGILTRAEGVKIIAYLFLAPEVAAALQPTNTGFSDVPAGHWANAVIGWAVDRGIVDGYGDGTFGPSDPLTGLQFAKMILAAFGYGAKGEFLGDRWATNTAQLAQKLGLMKQVVDAMNNTAGLKRQQASQMGYNAILEGINFVRFVEFLNDYVTGDILGSGTGESALDDKDHYDVANVEGTIGFDETDHTFTLVPDDADTYTFDPLPFANAMPKDYGREVKVLVVKASSAKNAKAIGSISYTDSILFESAKAFDYEDFANFATKGEDDYKGEVVVADVPVYVNGNDWDYDDLTDVQDEFSTEAGDITLLIGSNKKIEKVIIIFRDYAEAPAVDDDDDEIDLGYWGAPYDIENVFGFEGVKEGAQLFLTEMFDHLWVEELKTVEGKLTKYAGAKTAPTSFTVDGKTYNASAKINDDVYNIYDGENDPYELTNSLNKDVVIYIDEYDNVIAGEAAEDAASKEYYAFIEAAERTDSQDWGIGKKGVNGYFVSMTGEKVTFKLNPDDYFVDGDILVDEDDIPYGYENALVTVTEKKSGTNAGTYSINVVDYARDVDDIDPGKTKAVYFDTNDSLNANRNTVFVYYRANGSVKVVTGIANMPKMNDSEDVTAMTVAYFDADASYAQYVFLTHELALKGEAADDFYYLLKIKDADVYLLDDEEVCDIAAVTTDGKKVTLTITAEQYDELTDSTSDLCVDDSYYFKGETSDGITELSRPDDDLIDTGAGYTASTAESMILDGGGTLDFADDVVVVSVSSNRSATIGTSVLKAKGDSKVIVHFEVDDDDLVTFLVLEVA